MKIQKQVIHLFAVLFLLTALFSCQKEDAQPSVDFEELRLALEDHSDHTSYMKAQYTLFSQLENKEIDLFGIQHFLKNQGFKNVCLVNAELLDGFTGGQKYLDGFCAMQTHQFNLHQEFPSLSELSDTQFLSLFKFQASNSSAASMRTADCLGEFNSDMNLTYNYCAIGLYAVGWDYYADCIDTGTEWNVGLYESCCDNGGTGCPPE